MRTRMGSGGGLVIPKTLREQAGLHPGMEVEVRCRDGIIEIEPVPIQIRLERRGPFLVAVADGPMPVLTNEMVNRTLDEIRAERGMIYDERSTP